MNSKRCFRIVLTGLLALGLFLSSDAPTQAAKVCPEIPGTWWGTAGPLKLSVSGFGSQTDEGIGVVVFGPDIDVPLEANEFGMALVDSGGFGMEFYGTYAVPKPCKIEIASVDEQTLADGLYSWLVEDPGFTLILDKYKLKVKVKEKKGVEVAQAKFQSKFIVCDEVDCVKAKLKFKGVGTELEPLPPMAR